MDRDDTLLIVDGYVTSRYKENIMVECIKRLKPLGFKILTTSHKPLSEKIQKLSDYTLTDNIDIQITNKNKYDQIKTFYKNNDFYTEDFFGAEVYKHTPNVLVGIENAVKFAKNYGFKYFLKFDYDFHLDSNDIEKVDSLFKIIKDKKAIFFGYNDFVATHVMFSECDFYLDNILPIKNEDDYYENCKKIMNFTSCVELYLASLFKYKNVFDKFILLENQPGYYFTNSKCNIIDSFDLVKITKVLNNETNTFYNNLICFKYTGENNNQNVKIKIYEKYDLPCCRKEIINIEETPDNNFNFFNFEMQYNKDYKIIIWDSKNNKQKEYTINTNNIFDILHDGYIQFYNSNLFYKKYYNHNKKEWINNKKDIKNIFVISAYPSNKKRLEALKSTIKTAKNENFDILVSTNYPIVDEEILSLIDYYIYDKLDVKSLSDYDVINTEYGWYFSAPGFRIETTYDNGYHFDIFRNIFLGCKLINNYEHFVYTDGDFEFNKDSANELLEIKQEMINDNKKLFFFKKIIHNNEEDKFNIQDHFTTGVFGGCPKFFTENIKLPIDVYEWMSNDFLTSHALEMSMYDGLKHVLSDIYITNSDLLERIQYSKLSNSTEQGLKNILFFEKDNLNITHIFLYNTTDKKIRIELYLDQMLIKNLELDVNWYHIDAVPTRELQNKTLKQIIYVDNEIETIREIDLSKKLEIMRKTNRFIQR